MKRRLNILCLVVMLVLRGSGFHIVASTLLETTE